MSKIHPVKKIVQDQKNGIHKGIYSVCSANDYVIEAVMERALKDNEYVLIESTANQVNQYGGYTGMLPKDFKAFVNMISEKVCFPKEKIILGGDHLGPLTWKNESSKEAMEKSHVLIREYVLAGFTKIHIDTSMHLADDDNSKVLDTKVIADRAAQLCKTAEAAFEEYRKVSPDAMSPVYVVGSEVPIPGGSQEEEEGIQVTKVTDFKDTVETFHSIFMKYELNKAWDNVVAVVVQPGVEFGDESVHEYDRVAARQLVAALGQYPQIVFEGHSTDYQTDNKLKEMVEDGIAILKVGPALTFAMREGLFALNYIENELFKYNPEIELSNFIETLDNAMVKNPSNWEKHYHGSPAKIRYARKYSFSDRCRYYLPIEDVRASIERLINNLKQVDIPMTLIDQFMPVQYNKMRKGLIKKDPEAMLKDRIDNYIDDYVHATSVVTK